MIQFYGFCPHYKGEWAGQKMVLEPWQEFIVANIFGWKWSDSGYRRFKIAYVTVSRKNGKTTLVAPAGLYMLIGDNEPGAEVYSAAIDRDQAREIFDAAKAMVEMSDLSRIVKTFQRNIHVPSTMSKFEPLSADEKRQHGKNIHAALCDELHVWPKAGLWSVLRTGMGARRQPLQWAITTAGDDQATICYEVHDYTRNVLTGFRDGSFVDDTFFGIIYTLDRKSDWPELKTRQEFTGAAGEIEEDAWDDPKNWPKANPNLGISVKEIDLADECRTAVQMPSSQNDFLRLRMNVWTSQVTRWISLDLWDDNYTSPTYTMEGREVNWEATRERFRHRFCVAGIDLSSVDDLTCCVYMFPRDDDRQMVDVIMRTWCPESKITDKKNKYREQYRLWSQNKWIHTTEGNAIDYSFVRREIVGDASFFDLKLIGVDRAFDGIGFSIELQKDLGHSEKNPIVITCTNHPGKIGPVCQEFERRLLERKINHGGNPILRFMADSVAVREDADGNKKPEKAKSQGKIDGIVSMLYALDRLMRSKPPRKIQMPVAIGVACLISLASYGAYFWAVVRWVV